MPKLINKEEREKQIKDLCEGTIYSFIGWDGEYKNQQTYFRYHCQKHGIKKSKLKVFLATGKRCMECAASTKRKPEKEMKEKILEICSEMGYQFINWKDDYKGIDTDFHYICQKHGLKISTPYHFIKQKNRCRQCHLEKLGENRKGKWEKTAHQREVQIKSKCKKEGYIFIGWKNGYNGCHSLITLNCPNCGEWVTKLSVFLTSKCPNCTTYGYSPKRKGTLYCLRSECGRFVKIGITNNRKSRFETLKRKTPFDFYLIELFTHEDGSKVQKWEKIFHATFESANLTGFDGCTEWLKWNPEIAEWFRYIN